MGKTMPFSLGRLKEIARRQDPPSWGPHYDPAIRAVREEAPSDSRFYQVWSQRLGRICHALSTPEHHALLLALLHPKLFELQEQRVLHPSPRSHPLAGHSTAAGMELPPLCGTVQVCERLDMLARHSWAWIDSDDGLERLPVPIPFIGDLLLFLHDDLGPYCVNWTVKTTEDDFVRKTSQSEPSKDPEADERAERSRHAIEERYYADAGIPTVRVTESSIPLEFVRNLQSLLLWQYHCPELQPSLYWQLCEQLQASTTTGQPPFEIVLSMVHRYDLPLEVVRAAFATALLMGDVKVDLMDCPVLINIPLRPPRRDPWQVLAPWFQRPAA